MFYTIGGFTLDDTVQPDGTVQWSAPGGNALYSAIGAKFWDAKIGIITPVGENYPQSYLDDLSGRGFDISGIRRINHPSFHVWILHEGSGKRQIIYRLDSGKNSALDPNVADLKEGICGAQGALVCPIPGASQAALVEHLLQKNVPTFLDLIVVPDQIDVKHGHNPALWSKITGFLPSIEEVIALFGDHPLVELLDQLLPIAPQCFAVKMGHHGCVVRDPADGLFYHIPAYPAKVIDATGAGDSYCGGFMVGMQKTGSAIEAALYGTVSASFLIEGFGALHALSVTAEQAQQRLAFLRPLVTKLSESKLELIKNSR